MKKRKSFEAGDKARAICRKCKKIVPATFHYGDYKIPGSGVVVPGVLFLFCDKCGKVAGIPHQSSDTIHTGMLTAHRLLEDLKKWTEKWQRRAKKDSSMYAEDFLGRELLPKLKKMSLPPFTAIMPVKEK